jgi:hypothetical protein
VVDFLSLNLFALVQNIGEVLAGRHKAGLVVSLLERLEPGRPAPLDVCIIKPHHGLNIYSRKREVRGIV